jgi:hypothetical protein
MAACERIIISSVRTREGMRRGYEGIRTSCGVAVVDLLCPRVEGSPVCIDDVPAILVGHAGQMDECRIRVPADDECRGPR